MPSGSSKTGRITPKIPGSSSVWEDITGSGAWMNKGDAVRRVFRIRRQRSDQKSRTTTQPQNHNAKSSAGARVESIDPAGVTPTGISGKTKGWLICSIAADNGCTTVGGLGHSNCLPKVISRENGI